MTAPEIDEATMATAHLVANEIMRSPNSSSARIIALALIAQRALQREKDAKIAESNDFWPREGADIAAAIREI